MSDGDVTSPTRSFSFNGADQTFATLFSELSEKASVVLAQVKKESEEAYKTAKKNHLTATGVIVRVEDPMFEALYNDMRDFRKILRNIRGSTFDFLKSIDAMGSSCSSLSTILLKSVGTDDVFSSASLAYSQAINNVAIGGSRLTTRGMLEESLQITVLNPIEQHMAQIENIERQLRNYDSLIVYMRALRETMKATKNKSGFKEEDLVTPQGDYDKCQASYNELSQTLFNDLHLMKDSRNPIIFTLFESLKRCQYSYFQGAASTLKCLIDISPPAERPPFINKPEDEKLDAGKMTPITHAVEKERARRVSISTALVENAEKEKEMNIKLAIELKSKEQSRLESEIKDLRDEEEFVREQRSRLAIQLAEQERGRRISEAVNHGQNEYLDAMRSRVASLITNTDASEKERERLANLELNAEDKKNREKLVNVLNEAAGELHSQYNRRNSSSFHTSS